MLKLRNSIDINIPFGIEIEFSKANLEVLRKIVSKLHDEHKISESIINTEYKRWQVKTDKSITENIGSSEYGGELISPILIDSYNTWQDISLLCNLLKENDAKIYDIEAGHIHISSSILNNSSINFYRLFKLWVAFEDIIFKFSYNGNDARKNIFLFAAPMYKMFFEYQKDMELASNMHDIFKLDFSDRNYALNFENYMKVYKGIKKDKNTIEIRCPNGSLDPIIWQNNVNFFIKLINYAVSDKFDEEKIKYYINNNHYSDILSMSFNTYSNINMDKANILANLIFKGDIDKYYFMEQYTKILKR